MIFLPIETDWLNEWAAAINPGDGSADAAVAAAAELGLHLPKPNPFIPEDLSLRELPADPPALPSRLPKELAPIASIFHRQDDVFRQPKAHVMFYIRSPYITQDADKCMKTELWCRAVQEDLNVLSYDAEIAGVRYSLGLASGAMSLFVAGFNDKLGALLDTITTRMRNLTSIPE